ncbi:hypothetical protein SPBR_02279 [Sporothrix brasiliensis 5110]|uniref:EF-hand domain-containing protein n=1 Tax=Sporothrix brasiliensis 5110 TaxID=1398154 RepID=A0A0C2F0K5_9PEZI|nr:uncharacterized protein SPBR_02279 [Sporothrix brasiliensis 5110]KIH92324.1 hypothetical protein SPBR_02279 [Sporothrix brasiliensis 5110]
MVFFYFGPSASSWATGNDQFSSCRQLPPPIQTVWDSLGEHFADQSLGGTRIDWMSTGVDGSYCLMLKDGNVLSNRTDFLQSIHIARQTQPYAAVDHVSFSPYGAYLVRFNTGEVMLSPETSGRFPDAFVGLTSDFVHFAGPLRNTLQPTQLEYVFWGPSDSVLVKARGGALRWQGLPESLVTELRALTVGVDMLSAGFHLSKRTTLCPWDGDLFFLEFESFLGSTAKAYPYSLRQHRLSADAMQYVVLNQRPPAHLLAAAGPTSLLPPPPPTPPASAPPRAPPGPPPDLPPRASQSLPHRPTPQVQAQTRGPLTPVSTPYIPGTSPTTTHASKPETPVETPASPLPSILLPEEQEQNRSEDEERIDAIVHTLAMPDDIRSVAEEVWDLCTMGVLEEPKYVTASDALQLFAASELSSEDIDMIWEKSDLDHNGQLDREEFLQAMYLVAIQQYLRGISDRYGLQAHLDAAATAGEVREARASAAENTADAAGETMSRDLPRDAAAQPSLRGAVKDIFKLFVETGSQIGSSYKQSVQAARQKQEQMLAEQLLAEQQLAAMQAEYGVHNQPQLLQQQLQQQQMLEALEAMQINAQSSMLASQNAAIMSQFGALNAGGGNDGGGHDGEDDANKDSKSGMAKQLRESLLSSIVTESPNVRWEDVAGLASAKDELQEAVVFPLRFPHMFQGKRKPRRAILLYGPPGTGKSYLAKAVATEVEYTLFSISATDLTSKWFGESESLVRQLFELAREKKPSVIFIDEIDALCNSRESGGGGGGGGGGDDATTARLKTEFLVQMDGVGHGNNEGVVLLAATNLPWSLDPAIRRRFQKRIHIPLPDDDARAELFRVHGGDEWAAVVGAAGGPRDVAVGAELARRTDGFSGSDIANAVQDALMLPVKRVRGAQYFARDATGWWVPCEAGSAGARQMTWKSVPQGRARAPPLTVDDFFASVAKVKPSVGANEITRCAEWTAQFGLEGA